MDTTLIITKERQIGATPSKVWSILTDASNIEKWLGTKTTSEWKAGSEIIFSFTWDNKDYKDRGTILQYEKEKLFAYNYWSVFSDLPDIPENYSIIRFEITPFNNGTLLTLTHSNFATEMMYKHSDKNWEETMDTIKNLSTTTTQSV